MDDRPKWTESLSCKIEDGLMVVNGVGGYLLPGDAQLLTFFATKLPGNARIAEIGSFMGLSGLLMARALYCKGEYSTKIYCIDTWEGSPEHQSMKAVREGQLFEIFKTNIARSGLASYFIPIRKDSAAASLDFQDRSLDLIFIDGDHSFKGCLADLEAWYPKLKPGGILLGHDGENEVRQAVEFFLQGKDLSCITFGVPGFSNYFYRIVERGSLLV